MEKENFDLELQDSWWKNQSIVELLFKQFKQYLLGLLLSVPSDRSNYEFFTGFLFWHRDHLFWITAGHVIDKIDNFLNDENHKLIIRWFDFYPNENAGSIPKPLCNLGVHFFYITFRIREWGGYALVLTLHIRKCTSIRANSIHDHYLILDTAE